MARAVNELSSTLVNKIQLVRWALCKPEANLNILSAVINNIRHNCSDTMIKQMFFKKHASYIFIQTCKYCLCHKRN